MGSSLFKPEDLLSDTGKKVCDADVTGPHKNSRGMAKGRDIDKRAEVFAKHRQELQQAFGVLEQDTLYNYVSRCAWSMHDLLLYVLDQTGPADVTFCTWAISEDAVRMLHKALEDGKITSLNAIFDRRVKIRKETALEFARSLCTKIYLVDCHAKVTLVSNNSWGISINSSANMSKNRRIEAGVLSTDLRDWIFHNQWMMEELNGKDPFETMKQS